ncbi:DUF2267 domain-containing protein [Streptomyces sp. 900105755]
MTVRRDAFLGRVRERGEHGTVREGRTRGPCGAPPAGRALESAAPPPIGFALILVNPLQSAAPSPPGAVAARERGPEARIEGVAEQTAAQDVSAVLGPADDAVGDDLLNQVPLQLLLRPRPAPRTAPGPTDHPPTGDRTPATTTLVTERQPPQ